MNTSAVIGHYLCLIKQHQTDSSACRDDTERFVRCIEYERAPHDYLARNREKKGDRRTMFISEPDSILCTTRDNQAHQQCELFDLGIRAHRHIA
jgi:hypothetical protein